MVNHTDYFPSAIVTHTMFASFVLLITRYTQKFKFTKRTKIRKTNYSVWKILTMHATKELHHLCTSVKNVLIIA